MDLQELFKEAKKCRKKEYCVEVMKPELGTALINKLEQAHTLNYFNGQEVFTPDEVSELKENDSEKYEFLMANCELVKELTPYALKGAFGEMWVISINKLIERYTFEDGTKLTEDELGTKLKKGKLKIKTKANGNLTWCTQVTVDKGEVTVITADGTRLICNNQELKDHGDGDYLLCCCSKDNGQPDLSDVWVVNGVVFEETYEIVE